MNVISLRSARVLDLVNIHTDGARTLVQRVRLLRRLGFKRRQVRGDRRLAQDNADQANRLGMEVAA